jgi:hypothetical protein
MALAILSSPLLRAGRQPTNDHLLRRRGHGFVCPLLSSLNPGVRPCSAMSRSVDGRDCAPIGRIGQSCPRLQVPEGEYPVFGDNRASDGVRQGSASGLIDHLSGWVPERADLRNGRACTDGERKFLTVAQAAGWDERFLGLGIGRVTPQLPGGQADGAAARWNHQGGKPSDTVVPALRLRRLAIGIAERNRPLVLPRVFGESTWIELEKKSSSRR